VLHRDSLGSERVIRAGQDKLMTAGEQHRFRGGDRPLPRPAARRAAVDGPAHYLGQGRDQVVLSAAEPARLLLLGGEPFGEPMHVVELRG